VNISFTQFLNKIPPHGSYGKFLREVYTGSLFHLSSLTERNPVNLPDRSSLEDFAEVPRRLIGEEARSVIAGRGYMPPCEKDRIVTGDELMSWESRIEQQVES